MKRKLFKLGYDAEVGTEIFLTLFGRARIYFRRRPYKKPRYDRRYILDLALDTRRTHRAYIDFRTGSLMCERCGVLSTIEQIRSGKLIEGGEWKMRDFCTGEIHHWCVL